MKRQLTWMVAGLLIAAPTLGAQSNVAVELGAFAQYSKYDSFTHLKDGYGVGARFGIYPFKNFALEYEADMTKTSSSLLGDLTAWNNRIDGIFYFPMSPKLKLLVGGGWTGTRYYSDTTLNEFDSGGNAVIGFKYCFSDKWAMRTDVTPTSRIRRTRRCRVSARARTMCAWASAASSAARRATARATSRRRRRPLRSTSHRSRRRRLRCRRHRSCRRRRSNSRHRRPSPLRLVVNC